MAKSNDLLPVFSATTFGPAMIVAAIHGSEQLPMWSRWLLGVTGAGAIGLGLHALLNQTPPPVNSIVSNLVRGTEREMEHTNDPKVAMQIAFDHIKEDPAYYDKLEKAGL